MCGRFNFPTNPALVAAIFNVVRGMEAAREYRPRSNVAPTTRVVAFRSEEGERAFFLPKWGLIPSWSKDAKIAAQCINTRSESVETKPAFRSAFKKRRCVVLADGFYEWKKGAKPTDKQPYYISLKGGKRMPFAGLWETWNSPDGPVETCTICTTDANELMTPLHDRMPVILPEAVIDHWLDLDVSDAAELKPLLAQYPDDEMQFWPVSKRVGSVKNEDPHLTDPVEVDGAESPPAPKGQRNLFGA
jgi:putative SOS response-associated peptidase YedK